MADEYLIAVTKRGYDVQTETDINNYVFLSSYNTFKIIRSGQYDIVALGSTPSGVEYTLPHLLDFTPLVMGFMKQESYNQAIPPNMENISTWGAKAGVIGTGVSFISVGADANNMIFKIANSNSGDRNVSIRYFCLESI